MHTPIGAIYQDGSCSFTVWAPKAQSVEVLLNEEKKIPLTTQPYGYWSAQVDTAKPGDLYHFLLDGEKKRPDPAAIAQPGGVHGPSEVIDLQGYLWQDQDWRGIPMEDMILYELHVGTFTPEHTFAGIEKKLDYLVDLGINTLELMPIAQFPGARNWGYDGVYPFAVHHDYGGPLGLMQLVDACHQKGIAVLLDVVYNHFGPEGNYTSDFGPYFTDTYHTPWGMAINFDDAYCDAVRQFFIQNALMWLRDFHIDGLRLDAVHAIKDLSARHFLSELSDAVRQLRQTQQRPLTLIGECDLNDAKYINPHQVGGYALDGQWIDEFHHALRAYLTGEQSGYYSDFGTFDQIRKAFEKTYVYNGIYSQHRKKTFGSSAEDNPYSQFVVFSQNHDQVGNRMLGERLTTTVDFETLKLCAGAVLLSPYVPMLFMGEEYGETNPFQYFVSHTDPELVEAVREGRKREFAYFIQEGIEAPDPQAEETFLHSSLSWEMDAPERQTMLAYYKKLIALRKEHPALVDKDRKSMKVHVPQDEVLVLERTSHIGGNKFKLFCVLNFSNEAVTVSLPGDSTKLDRLLDSADTQWKGQGVLSGKIPSVSLQRKSIAVYERSA